MEFAEVQVNHQLVVVISRYFLMIVGPILLWFVVYRPRALSHDFPVFVFGCFCSLGHRALVKVLPRCLVSFVASLRNPEAGAREEPQRVPGAWDYGLLLAAAFREEEDATDRVALELLALEKRYGDLYEDLRQARISSAYFEQLSNDLIREKGVPQTQLQEDETMGRTSETMKLRDEIDELEKRLTKAYVDKNKLVREVAVANSREEAARRKARDAAGREQAAKKEAATCASSLVQERRAFEAREQELTKLLQEQQVEAKIDEAVKAAVKSKEEEVAAQMRDMMIIVQNKDEEIRNLGRECTQYINGLKSEAEEAHAKIVAGLKLEHQSELAGLENTIVAQQQYSFSERMREVLDTHAAEKASLGEVVRSRDEDVSKLRARIIAVNRENRESRAALQEAKAAAQNNATPSPASQPFQQPPTPNLRDIRNGYELRIQRLETDLASTRKELSTSQSQLDNKRRNEIKEEMDRKAHTRHREMTPEITQMALKVTSMRDELRVAEEKVKKADNFMKNYKLGMNRKEIDTEKRVREEIGGEVERLKEIIRKRGLTEE